MLKIRRIFGTEQNKNSKFYERLHVQTPGFFPAMRNVVKITLLNLF